MQFFLILKIDIYRTDTEAELELVKKAALESGAADAVVCNHWAEGGLGAANLADAIIAVTSKSNDFKFLYDINANIVEKINTIAKEMYGAGEVILTDKVIIFKILIGNHK